MKPYKNFLQLQAQRELDARYGRILQDRFLATEDFIERLGLCAELDGHAGCVNCLEWNHSGTILLSGSDDLHIKLWDPFREKLLTSVASGHHGNIFSVKFVPNTGDRNIISGAADHSVRVHDVHAKEVLSICTCHSGRVKRCAVDLSTPHLFWSAGEDGLILQHDLRTSHVCSSDVKKPKNALIDLKSFMGMRAEAKCMTINPLRSEMIAVGANDPFVRIYDRRMIKIDSVNSKDNIPDGAVQYFAPGHLPPKVQEYKKKYRSLASTYVEFSPDGKEVLANLGGEQIYLFALSEDAQKTYHLFPLPDVIKTKNGAQQNGYKNGTSVDSTTHQQHKKEKFMLPPRVEKIKQKANEAFESKKYGLAIHLYNDALQLCPESAVLFGNRAAALLKRNWDGDCYEALKDCQTAVQFDPDHFKAHIRLARCLFELKRINEADMYLRHFKVQFPNYVQTSYCRTLDDDITKALAAQAGTSTNSSRDNSPKSTVTVTTTSSSSSSSSPSSSENSTATPQRRNRNSATPQTRSYFLRSNRGSAAPAGDNNTTNNSNNNTESNPTSASNRELQDEEDDDDDDDDELMNEDSDVPTQSTSDRQNQTQKKIPEFFTQEKEYQKKSLDYQARYLGASNVTTDIKEANFFGNYIVAGSDDGSFFIWEKSTTNIVKILRGDESITNAIQPHPTCCLLATSGIENVVRLWTPLPQDKRMTDRVVEDWNDAAIANQRRMNVNPFQVILMNMGYRLNYEDSGGSDEDNNSQDSANAGNSAGMNCNPT